MTDILLCYFGLTDCNKLNVLRTESEFQLNLSASKKTAFRFLIGVQKNCIFPQYCKPVKCALKLKKEVTKKLIERGNGPILTNIYYYNFHIENGQII